MSHTAYPSHRRIWTRRLPLALLLLIATPLHARILFQAEYDMQVSGFTVGRVTRTLSLDKGVYHFQSEAHPTGLMGKLVDKTFHEDSRWMLKDGHIRPLSYRYLERAKKHDKIKSDLVFDWPHRAAWDRRRYDLCWPLSDDSQDAASASFAMMVGAAHHRPTIEIHSIGGPKPLIQHYRWAGSGTYRHGDQNIKVVKYEQTDPGHIHLHAWFAPARAWLPVYIHQEVTDGADTTMTLAHVDTLDAGALLKILGE